MPAIPLLSILSTPGEIKVEGTACCDSPSLGPSAALQGLRSGYRPSGQGEWRRGRQGRFLKGELKAVYLLGIVALCQGFREEYDCASTIASTLITCSTILPGRLPAFYPPAFFSFKWENR
ncbi:hypothetical protein AB6805_14810 [Chitinophaga sp. RCC_12]|uniref:hypothetical protein n=1 Tax=Chitinophaga sp. RCC_12 TaxID=3239226 RepID=UPI003526C21F